MDSNEGGERDSIISYDSFLYNVHGSIIQPPPPLAVASATNDDAVTTWDIEMAAVPDRPVGASSMTQLPSSDGYDAPIASHSATAPIGDISLPRAPLPRLLEHASPPISSSPTFVPTDEMNSLPLICNDRPGDEEEELEEVEDDYAPPPPETIAASFEVAKPELIEDNDDASIPPEQIAAPFEGLVNEEEKQEEVEDDYAPLPPETIAASFKAADLELIEDSNDASVPPEQVAAPCEGFGDEEEETEDDYAPLPPETIAASFEVEKPELIEHNDDVLVRPEQIAAPFEGLVNEEEKQEEVEDDYAPLPPEMIAASFDVADLELIEDSNDASVPPEQVAARCEGLGDEEEEQEETEDAYAPLPPETIAASFEVEKPEVIKDNDDASIPPEQIAAPFYEEEKQEEVEDDWAPAPPETIAASYEMDGDANQKGMNESEVIDGYNGN